MTGRTVLKYSRVYIDGYDMSGYSRNFGPLKCEYEEAMDDAVTLAVKAFLNGQASIGLGTLNGLFDNTATSGLHVVMNGAGGKRNVMIPIGIQAVPAMGDPVFGGQFLQTAYTAGPSNNPVTASIPFANTAVTASNLTYANPWGVLLNALSARTAANTSTGVDEVAQTTRGGWMMYQVTAGNGTATIKVQDASTNSNGSFADLLSSGSINCAAPISGVVALANTATVKRYTRWQIALGTATTVTFALAFFRSFN
jgi:hypothetical protein